MLAQQWKLLSPDPGIPGGDMWGVCLLGKSEEERTENLGAGKRGGTQVGLGGAQQLDASQDFTPEARWRFKFGEQVCRGWGEQRERERVRVRIFALFADWTWKAEFQPAPGEAGDTPRP